MNLHLLQKIKVGLSVLLPGAVFHDLVLCHIQWIHKNVKVKTKTLMSQY